MKLRSAQFVLLVLLLTSLSLSESSSLRMADDLLVGSNQACFSLRAEAAALPSASQAHLAPASLQPQLAPATLRTIWTMRHPAAHAAALQATTANARAQAPRL